MNDQLAVSGNSRDTIPERQRKTQPINVEYLSPKQSGVGRFDYDRVPAFNPRAERNELVQFTATLGKHAMHRLLLNLDDQTYQATLDYLDPDLPHIFTPAPAAAPTGAGAGVGNKAVRQALVIGCETHIAATYC